MITETAGISPQYLFPSDQSEAQIKNPEVTGLTMNGLLHTFISSAADQPSLVPLIWTGWGRENIVGLGLFNPQIACGKLGAPGLSECRFNPRGRPSGGNPGPTGAWSSIWYWGPNSQPAGAYGDKIVVTRTDTSTRVFRLGMNVGNINTDILDPWSEYANDESPLFIRMCSMQTSGTDDMNACFFRPDQDGSRTKWLQIVD